MKILVTGGAGFIGSHITRALIDSGHMVAIVDDLSTGCRENIPTGTEFTQVDIRSSQLNDEVARIKPDALIHLAAQISVSRSIREPNEDASVNVIGLINVLNACVAMDVKQVVYASSAAIFGQPKYLGVDEEHPAHPTSFYGISKYVSEHYLRVYSELYQIKTASLRFANVYGPGQGDAGEGGVVSIFRRNLLEGKTCVIDGDGEQTRDFIYVGDIASAVKAAVECGEIGTFNIGTGVPTSIIKLYREMEKIHGAQMSPSLGPPRAGDIRDSYFCVDKAASKLGFVAKTSLRDGLLQLFHT